MDGFLNRIVGKDNQLLLFYKSLRYLLSSEIRGTQDNKQCLPLMN